MKISHSSKKIIDDWLHIQSLSFEPTEQVSRNFVVEGVQNPDQNFVACLYEQEKAIGMLYASENEPKIAVLWYVAVHPDYRSKGIGAHLYGIAKGWSIGKQCRFMWLEVDLPGKDEWSQRRLDWYRQMGCVRLEGVEYLQTVDTTSIKTPMCIMLDILAEPSPKPQEVFDAILRSCGKENLRQIGELRFA